MRRYRLKFLLFGMLCILIPTAVCAEELPQESADQLAAYDLGAWEAYYQTLPESVRKIWDGANLTSVVEHIAGGNGITYDTVLTAFQDIVLYALRESMGAYASLLGVALISCVAEILCGGREGIGETVGILCFGMSAAAVSYALMRQVALASATIDALTAFTEIAAPVLSFSLAAVGSVTLSGAIQPMMAFLSVTITGFFKSVILPLTVAGGGSGNRGGPHTADGACAAP